MIMEQPLKAVKRSIPAKVYPALAEQSARAGGQHTSLNGKATAADSAAKPAQAPGPMRIGNVYQPECPAQRALETIASKWAVLILHSLLVSPLRFNALQRKLPGISQKVLTEQLRRLERFGIIARAVHPTVPPSVEYSLTAAGRELKGAMGALCDWSNKHAALLVAGEASSAIARGVAKTRAMRAATATANGSAEPTSSNGAARSSRTR